jgi:hypothetical protein
MHAQRVLLLLSLLVALVGVSSPSKAGFWDDMFDGGGGPARGYEPAPAHHPRHAAKTSHRHAHLAWSAGHRHHARPTPPTPADVAITAPQHFNSVAEAAEAAKADETLKPGDIVSSAEGLLVYVGDKGIGRDDDFVPAGDRHVKARLRKLLSAYAMPETPLTNPAAKKTDPKSQSESKTQSETKSQSTALQAIQTFVSDSHGKRIRFVGGRAPQ